MFSALLGKKGKQKSQSIWAVVLDRASDEFARKRAMAELRHTFGVSSGEAEQLLENTPIILLDQIPHETAVKIKDYFSNAKINCFLTDDRSVKSKYFRTVWPSAPKLESIVGQMAVPSATPAETVKSTQSSAPLELNPWKPEDLETAAHPKQVTSGFIEEGGRPKEMTQEHVLEQTICESKPLEELTAELRKEDEMLKSRVADTERKKEISNREGADRFQDEEKKLEDKNAALHNENASLNRKVQELEKMVKLSDLKQIAKSHKQVLESLALREAKQQLASLKEQLDQFRGEHMRSQDLLKEAQTEAGTYENELTQAQKILREAQAEAAQFQAEWSHAQKELSKAQAECVELKESLSKAERVAQELRDEKERLEETCAEVKGENRSQAVEITEVKKQLDHLAESRNFALQEIEETKLNYAGELEALRKTHENEMKQVVDEVLGRLTERETELEEWKHKAADWNSSYSQLLKENELLKVQQNEELESLKNRNRELLAQLDQAQKQIRNFSFQLEQQELAQKRLRAASDLAHQESHFKSLVQSQRTLETRLTEADQELKNVLAEQEVVEREIVKAKQVQKYLMEQSKIKEKTRLAKTKSTGESASETDESPEAFDSSEKS